MLLAVIGPNWSDVRDEHGNRRLDDPNDFVRIEIAAALQRDIPVIPILLDGARIPKADQLPDDLKELASRNGLDVRHASFHDRYGQIDPWSQRAIGSSWCSTRTCYDLAEAEMQVCCTVRRPGGDQRHPRSVQGIGLREFLRDKRNQQVLGWLGGGLVVERPDFGSPLSISFLL